MEYDVFNAIYAALIVFILFSVYKIPLNYYLVILGHLALVFLTNDFLFPIEYMPDQFKYIYAASNIRDSLDFFNPYAYGAENVANAALVFAVFPILFLNSVFSIAIINFMLYSILFIFLYRKKILVDKAIWFYLLFPSFALYAALSLRDMLILFFMTLSTYWLYRDKILLAMVASVPLLFIKSQNFLIFMVALLIYKSIEKDGLFSIKTFIKAVISGGILVVLSVKFSALEQINHYRKAMFFEDGGDISAFIPLASIFDLLFHSSIGAFYMILKPLPWEADSIIQLVQSIENIIIFYIIYRLIREQQKIKDKFVNFLLIYFIIAMSIYGIVVFNYGTAARYRFPFELVFILFSLSILYKKRLSERVKNAKN